MSYAMKNALEGLREATFREIMRFADRVEAIRAEEDDGTVGMARSIVRAAEEIAHEDRQREAAGVKTVKP